MDIVRSDDVNHVVRLHRAVYESEYGLDPSFADGVATQMAEFRRRGFPGPREGLWLARSDDERGRDDHADRGDAGARPARHLVLAPEARGTGAGRRLVDTVVDAARAAGYERLHLFTFADLSAAGALYRSVGFEVASSEDVVRWGRRMDWQRYELALQPHRAV